jgi:uridine kinase
VYDFALHDRVDASRWERVDPRPVVLVEGILVLAIPALRAALDLRVFVDAPADLRLTRRLERDLSQRGRTRHGVIEQYERTVRPMHDTFVAPSREHADLLLDGTRAPEGEAEQVLYWIRQHAPPA